MQKQKTYILYCLMVLMEVLNSSVFYAKHAS